MKLVNINYLMHVLILLSVCFCRLREHNKLTQTSIKYRNKILGLQFAVDTDLKCSYLYLFVKKLMLIFMNYIYFHFYVM